MKKILGLDLGTTSIGWAYRDEAENNDETSSIINSGVRIVLLTYDEEADFKKGKIDEAVWHFFRSPVTGKGGA